MIESIRLSGWRSYRNERAFDFDEGVNLLTGPNEAGKSTLFEAMTFAFLSKHNSKTRELKEIVPLGTTLPPWVEVVYRAEGERWRLTKQFLNSPSAILEVDESGEWIAKHTGDQADEHARAHLAADDKGLKPEHRGLGHALWYLQKDDPLPGESWHSAVGQGLGTLAAAATDSSESAKAIAAVEKLADESLTGKGQARKKHPLTQLTATLDSAETELARIEENLWAAEDNRERLVALVTDAAAAEADLKNLKFALHQLEEADREAGKFDEAKAKLATEVNLAAQTHAGLRKEWKGFEERRSDANVIRETLASKKPLLDEKTEKRTASLAARDTLRKRVNDELAPKTERLRGELATVKAVLQLRELNDRVKKADEVTRQVEELEKQLEEKRKALAEKNAPDAILIRQAKDLEVELQGLDGELRASSVRLSFDLPGVSLESRPEAKQDEATGEWIVTGPTTFHLGAMGSVSVRGAASLDELTAKREAIAAQIREVLAPFDVSAVAGLESLLQAREALISEGRELRGTKEALVKTIPQNLADLRQKLEELERVVHDAPEGVKTKTPEALAAVEEVRTDDLKTAEADYASAKRELQETEKMAEAVNDEVVRLQQAKTALEGSLTALESQNAEVLSNYGSADALERQLNEASRKEADVRRELTTVEASYDERVVQPRKRYQEAKARLQELDRTVRAKQDEINTLRGELSSISKDDLPGRRTLLEAEVESLRKRRQKLETELGGLRVLNGVLQALRQKQSAALAVPVAEVLTPWMAELTAGRYSGVNLGDDLVVNGLHFAPEAGAHLDLEHLSYGTHEQTVVLLRLALAKLLSGDKRQLVVLDDRLVNADPQRFEKLCRVIEEVGESCQVILATCDPERYVTLRANKVAV